MILTGESQRTRRKTCPSATLSSRSLTWTDSSGNPGLRGDRPTTNRLSHGTAREDPEAEIVHESVRSTKWRSELNFGYANWNCKTELLTLSDLHQPLAIPSEESFKWIRCVTSLRAGIEEPLRSVPIAKHMSTWGQPVPLITNDFHYLHHCGWLRLCSKFSTKCHPVLRQQLNSIL
jgi:hypothetical protein